MKSIEYFKELVNIPRCSKNHQPFISFIKKFAEERGYEVIVDDAKNILCRKSNQANLSLQSHYDIVCINDNNVVLIEDEKFFRAQDSTLGADNGVGCAMMMSLMDEGADVELVFTSDEEIGLIGANNLNFSLNSKYMLNLDTEEEGEVYIGCAGGVDVMATQTLKRVASKKRYFYKLNINDLPGGHSGVDIDKGIPNAFVFALSLLPSDAKIGFISGGERINSIPKTATILFSSDESVQHRYITLHESFEVFDFDVLELLSAIPNGVLEHNELLSIPQTSQNLAIISTKDNTLTIQMSLRSMDSEILKSLQNKDVEYFKSYGFDVKSEGKYHPWKPDINEFSQKVKEIYQKHNPNIDFKAIHAGLECAVFKDKFPTILITSIGPNIHNPHSLSERVEIESIKRVEKIVKEIVDVLS